MINDPIEQIKADLMRRYPGTAVLVPIAYAPGQVIAGISGVPERGIVLAAGRDELAAYQALSQRLGPVPIETPADQFYDSLRGLAAVRVRVQELSPEDRAVIADQALVLILQGRLAEAGIAIVDCTAPAEVQRTAPVLLLRLDVHQRPEDRLIVASSCLELLHLVVPLKNPVTFLWGVIWASPTVPLAGPRTEVNNILVKVVEAQAGLFISTYQGGNEVTRNGAA